MEKINTIGGLLLVAGKIKTVFIYEGRYMCCIETDDKSTMRVETTKEEYMLRTNSKR